MFLICLMPSHLCVIFIMMFSLYTKISFTAFCRREAHHIQCSCPPVLRPVASSVQVRYGGIRRSSASRRYLATVLLRPPSCHRPGRRQARHARILQIRLHLMQPRSAWSPLGMDQLLGSRQKRIRWAGFSAGYRAICPYMPYA